MSKDGVESSYQISTVNPKLSRSFQFKIERNLLSERIFSLFSVNLSKRVIQLGVEDLFVNFTLDCGYFYSMIFKLKSREFIHNCKLRSFFAERTFPIKILQRGLSGLDGKKLTFLALI